MQAEHNVFPLKRKIDLPQIKIPVGIYGKEIPPFPEDNIDIGEMVKDGFDDFGRSQKQRNQAKVKRALDLLGAWWRLHVNSTFVNRGEHFLTIYHREISPKKLDISLVTGKYMLVTELQELVSDLDARRRVYVGDLKLMGNTKY